MENLYKKLYFALFNAITDALRELGKRNYGCAEQILIKAQQEAEAVYLSEGD